MTRQRTTAREPHGPAFAFLCGELFYAPWVNKLCVRLLLISIFKNSEEKYSTTKGRKRRKSYFSLGKNQTKNKEKYDFNFFFFLLSCYIFLQNFYK